MTNEWFIADTHFGHESIIKYCQRPFKDFHEMDRVLIDNWNRLIMPYDIVYIVGDLFCKASLQYARDVLNKLNGKKILIKGNHDKLPYKFYLNNGFSTVVNSMEMKIAGERALISHYPYRPSLYRSIINKIKGVKIKHLDKRPRDNGLVLIHGHTHSKDKIRRRMINVCVDAWNFLPVSKQEIEAEICRHFLSKKR